MIHHLWNLLTGGGLMGRLTDLLTLRSKLRRSAAETDTVELQNMDHMAQLLMNHIVGPLKTELYETRREFANTKLEMQRLRKAIYTANACRYHERCPVLKRLHEGPPATAEEESSLLPDRTADQERKGSTTQAADGAGEEDHRQR